MELEATTPSRENLALAAELAAIVRPSWSRYHAHNRAQARFVCETPEGAPPASTEPTATAEPPATPAAPAASTETPGFDTPFRLEEVPEEYREHVERYINSTRPAVTRAFQTAAEQRQAAQDALELAQRLESPDTAYEALTSLLSAHGLELSEEDWELAQRLRDGYNPDDEPEGGQEDTPSWARRLIERAEAEDAAAEEAEELEARQALRTHVDTALAARAKQHGYGETRDDLPEPIRNAIAAVAAVQPTGQDGLPNMEGAQELFDAAVALEVNRILKAKTPDPVPDGGGPGERRIDVKDQNQRLALAEEVAARAMARTSA